MNDTSFKCSALIDSGVEGNFIDKDWARERGLPIHPLNPPITAHSLDGPKLMAISSITTSGNHREELELYLTKSPVAPLVFGHPWLALHGPLINRADNSISNWSTYCHACLVSAAIFCVPFFVSAEEIDLSRVPVMYHDLQAVFGVSRAASLPTQILLILNG